MTLRTSELPTKRTRFGYLRLYRDDVQAIEDLLLRHGKTCSFESGTYTFDRAEEMAQIPRKRLTQLVLTADNFSMTLERLSTEIEVRNPTVEDDGLNVRLAEILIRRRRRLLTAILARPLTWTRASTVAAFCMMGALLIVVASQSPGGQKAGGLTGENLLLLFVVAVVAGLPLTVIPQGLIINAAKKDAPTYLERKRDDILLNASFTIVGFALGILWSRISGG